MNFTQEWNVTDVNRYTFCARLAAEWAPRVVAQRMSAQVTHAHRQTAGKRYGGASYGGEKHTRTPLPPPPPPPPPVGVSTPPPRLRRRSRESWVSTLTLHAPISLHSHVHEVARTVASARHPLPLFASPARTPWAPVCHFLSRYLSLPPSLALPICFSFSLSLSFTWLFTRAVRYEQPAQGWYQSSVEILVVDTADAVEVRSMDLSISDGTRDTAYYLNFWTRLLHHAILRGYYMPTRTRVNTVVRSRDCHSRKNGSSLSTCQQTTARFCDPSVRVYSSRCARLHS